jgi:predicted PurR-regulated permease PerM
LLKKIKTPKWLILPTVSIITLGVIYGLFSIILQTGSEISSQQDYLLERLDQRLASILTWINVSTGLNLEFKNILDEALKSGWLTKAAGGIASRVGSFTGSFVMFALYYVVLLSGMSEYSSYFKHVGGENSEALIKDFEKIQRSIYSYMGIKTLISLGTGILATIICLIFGIKFPLFWGFLTFILNYIPSIGSIIATIPPVLMAVIQYDSFKPIIFLLILLIGVQMVMGNVVEPKIMGNKLRLNTLTVIFGLVFWGYLWGITGMMVSVPLLVLLKLIFEQIPALAIVSRIMGYPEKKN